MRIIVDRPDLITKKKVCKLMRENKMFRSSVRPPKFIEGWDTCIEQMIEVTNRSHI